MLRNPKPVHGTHGDRQSSGQKADRASRATGRQRAALGGTCGEGPWTSDRERPTLVRSAAAAAGGWLALAVQVTDNSAARILDNMRAAAEDRADLAVIAPPYFLLNATPANVTSLYLDAIRTSPLPVGNYDRGSHSWVSITQEWLLQIA